MSGAIGHNTQRLVRTARRRLLIAAIVDASGRGLGWCSAVAVVGAVASRLIVVPVSMWVVIGVPLVTGAAVGLGLGLSRRMSVLGAATVVDQRLGLKDRIATATSLGSREGGDRAFAELALAEAEQASAAADVRRATPVRFGNSWVVWPVASVMAVCAGLFIPRMDLLGRSRDEQTAVESARQRVQAQLADAGKSAAPRAEAELQRVDAKGQAESERVLDEVRRELAAGTTTPQAAAERAVKELDSLARDREQVAAASEQQREAIDQAMGDLRKSGPDGGPQDQSELARTLRSGDFAQASRATQDLLNSDRGSGRQDRAMAAEEMARLAEQLRAAARAAEDARKITERANRDAPQAEPDRNRADAGEQRGEDQPKAVPPPDHSAEELARSLERAAEALRHEPPSPSAPKPETPRQGPKSEPSKPEPSSEKPSASQPKDKQSQPESGPRMGEQGDTQPKQTSKPNQGSSGSEEHATPTPRDQAMKPKDASTSGRPESANPSETKPDSTADAAKAPANKGDQKEEQAPDQQAHAEDSSRKPSESSSSSSEKKSEKSESAHNGESDNVGPSGTPRTQGTSSTPHAGGANGAPKPSDRSGSKAPGEGPVPPAGTDAKGEASESKSGESKPEGASPDSGSKPGAPETDQTQSPQPMDGSSKSDQATPQSTPGSLPEPGREDIKRLADELQRLADAPKEAAARRQEAQRYRQQAEEVLKSASPEQREQLNRWGRDLADEMKKRGRRSGDHLETPGHGPGDRPAEPFARTADQPAASRTDTVDARTRPSSDTGKHRERVIAEWYSDRPVDRSSTDGQPALSSEGQSLAREAAREGERALEAEIVPSRFDRLLQRYFQRLPQRAAAKPERTSDAKPVEPAKDAPGAATP